MSRNKKDNTFTFPISTLAGSTFGNFLQSAKGHAIGKSFRSRFYLSAIVSFILDILSRGENLVWRKRIKRTEISAPPVFVIGFWRSGTTYLHNLLSQDKDFAFVTTFHTIFPHHVLSHARWMKYLTRFLMPENRPVDHVKLDLDFPQEEEIGMGNTSPLSFYHCLYFPKDFQLFIDKNLMFENVNEKQLARWKESYLHMIKKAIINTGGKRFISKNPPNTFRIKTLLELFPDAKFIYIYRNPYKVLQSFGEFLPAVIKGIQYQHFDPQELSDQLRGLFLKSIEYYDKEKASIPSANLLEVKYEALVQDPEKYLREIYSTFGLADFNGKRDAFLSYLSTLNNYKPRNYHIDDDTVSFVNENLSGMMEKWGYEMKF